MTRPHATRMLLAVLLVAAVQPTSGCGVLGGGSGRQSQSVGPATGSVAPTSSAGASATAETSAAPGVGTEPATGGATLSASDAQAIDAELDAVGRELERLDMPTDGDFDDISKGLE